MGMNKAKYAEIGRKLRNIPLEKPCMSYEWEELVEKLCASDDSGLHKIGIEELGKLKFKSTVNNKK
ncbi:MAG: hypothetical protein PHH28_02050 [Desulfuromonadaceae bacterium]|nr:hypothetical protein [Desulfuromonadaceae bacterium]